MEEFKYVENCDFIFDTDLIKLIFSVGRKKAIREIASRVSTIEYLDNGLIHAKAVDYDDYWSEDVVTDYYFDLKSKKFCGKSIEELTKMTDGDKFTFRLPGISRNSFTEFTFKKVGNKFTHHF